MVISIVAFLISILLPALSRAREMGRRLTCAANVKGVVLAMSIYADDNRGADPVPGFSVSSRDDPAYQVRYVRYDRRYGGVGDPENPERRRHDTEADGRDGARGSTKMSVTRSFWMLVRSGDVTVRQFVCPSSGDLPDRTERVDLYYDFEVFENVSYGLQVPFGPNGSRPRGAPPSRWPHMADKGPWYYELPPPNWDDRRPTPDGPPDAWRFANSPNHGGTGRGEGQNVAYADGHVSFEKTPIVGLDHDNIYTVMSDHASTTGRWYGVTPHHLYPFQYGPYPGQHTFGPNPKDHAATDTLIYP